MEEFLNGEERRKSKGMTEPRTNLVCVPLPEVYVHPQIMNALGVYSEGIEQFDC